MTIFLQGRIGPFDDIDTANTIAADLNKYQNLISPKLIFDSTKSLKDSIFKIVSLSRATYLLNMTLMDDFSFFESPSLQEMLQCITETPTKLLNHLPPNISQSVSVFIIHIYQHPDFLLSSMTNYFADDPTLHLVFSYSTFPAIFGFFTLDFFCKIGSEFIINLIPNPHLGILVRSMICSFFFSIHIFYEFFLQQLCVCYKPDMKHNQMFKLFSDVLSSSLDYLTIYHISVLKAFNSINHNECSSFFVNEILIRSIQFRNRWSDNRFNEPDSLEFVEFLESLTREEIEKLMEVVLSHTHFLSIIPKLPHSEILPRIPIILSDRDIYNLIQISGNSPNIAKMTLNPELLLNSASSFFEGKYTPFCAEIMNTYVRRTVNNSQVTQKNQDFEFNIRLLKRKANDLGYLSYLSFFEKTPFYVPSMKNLNFTRNIKFDDEFTLFSLNYYIKEVENEINGSEKAVSYLLHEKEIDNWCCHINKTHVSLLYCYAHQTVSKEVMHAKKKCFIKAIFPKHINKIFKKMNPFDESISYFSMISFLDFVQIPPKDESNKYKTAFLKTFSFSDYLSLNNSMELMSYVREVGKEIDRSFTMGYGARVWLLLNIIRQIEAIEKWENPELQFIIFSNALALANKECLFDTIIICKRFLFENEKLRKTLSQDTVFLIDLLFRHFCKIADNAPGFRIFLIAKK